MGVMEPERRRAERVACKIPVRLKGAGGIVTAVTVDLSRVGAMLRVRRESLAIAADAPTADVAREVNRSLGDVVVVELHYKMLGALVRKGMRVVRVTVSPDETDDVFLGCDFSTVLSPEQVSFLGVPLPEVLPEYDDFEDADAEDEATGALNAYLSSGDDASTAMPVLSSVTRVEGHGITIQITNPRDLPVMPERDDPGSLLEAVSAVYGDDVRLLVVKGVRPLWSGRAQIQGVSRAKRGSDCEMHLRFDPAVAEVASERLTPACARAPETSADRIQ